MMQVVSGSVDGVMEGRRGAARRQIRESGAELVVSARPSGAQSSPAGRGGEGGGGVLVVKETKQAELNPAGLVYLIRSQW